MIMTVQVKVTVMDNSDGNFAKSMLLTCLHAGFSF